MAKYKVFMTDSIFPDQKIEKDFLKEGDAELILASKQNSETFIKEGKDCDAVITVYAQVEKEFIDTLSNCKLIIKTGIGVNNIDVAAASQKKIMVANVPDYCINEVADHTLSLFLCLVRKICDMDKTVKNGTWDFNTVKPIPRLQGKVFGLLGFGSIAQSVARRIKSFGMDVIAYDPYANETIFADLGVKKTDKLEILLKTSDYLSLHAPLTKETMYIIDINALRTMKPEALLINTSRGPLIKEKDLIIALKDKIISGAALDVLEVEPVNKDSELLSLPNIIITPHAGFYSEGAGVELREKSAIEVIRTLKEGKPKSWINKNDFK